eukprot:1158878-Pelagomonas_calceolata.AAC.12
MGQSRGGACLHAFLSKPTSSQSTYLCQHCLQPRVDFHKVTGQGRGGARLHTLLSKTGQQTLHCDASQWVHTHCVHGGPVRLCMHAHLAHVWSPTSLSGVWVQCNLCSKNKASKSRLFNEKGPQSQRLCSSMLHTDCMA